MTINLKELSRRAAEAGPELQPPPRRWLARYLLPVALGAGLLLILAGSLLSLLRPARPVTVLPVLTARQVNQPEGTPVFQAAGWVEPRPQPILVTALAEGVVDRIHVVENTKVKKGDPIADLIDEDARLALRAAQAERKLRQAEVDSAKAVLDAAAVNLKHPVQLEAALAQADATLAQKRSEQAALPFQQETASAKLRAASVIYDKQKLAHASGAAPETQLQQSKADFESAKASVDEIRARREAIAVEIAALAKQQQALALRLELKSDETRAAAESKALLDAAQARLDLAQNAVDTAALRLQRMKIQAPIDGRVLGLIARPGSRLMGQGERGMPEASTVVSLYDPAALQVRADVRLEDAWRIHLGQRVHIAAAAFPGKTLSGAVLFMTSQADIQKNTIQVKIALDAPPEVLRPEMLVQATFLAPRPSAEQDTVTERVRVLVPRSLIIDEGGKKMVWIADVTSGLARKKPVETGVSAGDVVEVLTGLQVSDRLIVGGRDDLSDGQRIRITGEDDTLTPAAKHEHPAAKKKQ